MRITDKMAYNQVTSNLQKNRSEMSHLQNQAATQKRITKPSDDPAASARVLSARTEERGAQQFIKNINVARSFLEYSDQSLSELTEALVRAKELAIAQANDAGASPDTRRTVANEIEQIYNQAVQVANRKLGDRYIFAGYKTTTMPFEIDGHYKGDAGDMKIQINKDAYVAMNISGDKVFLGEGLGADGTIRSNPRSPRDVQDLDQERELEQAKQERARAREQESQTLYPLRGPAGAGTNQDEDVGLEEEIGKGINILRALKDFEIALRVNDKASIQDAIDSIDESITQVVNARAQVGARISAVNAAQDSLQKSVVDNKVTASQLEDADIFQVVSDINKTDATLKATLETSGKVVNMSLLDFLR